MMRITKALYPLLCLLLVASVVPNAYAFENCPGPASTCHECLEGCSCFYQACIDDGQSWSSCHQMRMQCNSGCSLQDFCNPLGPLN